MGRESVAYDLSKFEVREERKTPQMRLIENKEQPQRAKSLVWTACFSFIIVAMIVMTIYNQMIITEIGDQVSTYNAQLRVLQDENLKLKSSADANASLKVLEEYASSKLGMGKLDSEQVVYIDMQSDDQIQITEKGLEESGGEKLESTAKEIMEYLKRD